MHHCSLRPYKGPTHFQLRTTSVQPKAPLWLYFIFFVVALKVISGFGGEHRLLSSLVLDDHANVAARLRHDLERYRFLAFGTSRTYGAGLEGNRRLDIAYPYALSKNATNLAIRAAGPDYPALCLSTMLGDDLKADVITLEYNMKANANLARLAKRLRQRFPDATIIFLHLWMPFQYYHLPTKSNVKQTLERELKSPHTATTRESYQPFLDGMVNATEPSDWIFQADQGTVLEQIAAETGAYIYHMPRPSNPVSALTEYMKYFNHDMVHFSELGHLSVAAGIRDLILTIGSTHRSDRVNPWQDHDACESWYESGTIELAASAETEDDVSGRSVDNNASQIAVTSKIITGLSRNLEMVRFAKRKHGMEALPLTSSLQIRNPLPVDAQVYLSYMVTAPQQDYPTVVVSLTDLESPFISCTTTINPIDKTNRYAVHVMKHAFVGSIPKGTDEALITITAKEYHTKFPFRITGIMLSSILAE